MQDILEQYLRHFSHMLFLHTELADQNSQDPEILRSYICQGNVLEHFRDVEILVAGWVEAKIEDQAIEMSQDFVGWHLMEEGLEFWDQFLWIFVDLKQTDDRYDFLEGYVLGVLLFDSFRPLYPYFSEEFYENWTNL